MWIAELTFKIIADTSYNKAEAAIRNYLEALIFNGQILGREFPTVSEQDGFRCRLVLPGTEALAGKHHSSAGTQALQLLAKAGLGMPQQQLLGPDLMSNHTDPCDHHVPLILYCRFAQTNSMFYCLEHFAPVTLYSLPIIQGTDHQDLIRWQLQYQALDEIQMQQESVLQGAAERSLQGFNSKLNRQGRQFAKKMSQQLQQPVYYALYSGTSRDCATEATKCCPGCGGDWRLEQPLHQLFDFQCQHCQLVSNIAWQCQD